MEIAIISLFSIGAQQPTPVVGPKKWIFLVFFLFLVILLYRSLVVLVVQVFGVLVFRRSFNLEVSIR